MQPESKILSRITDEKYAVMVMSTNILPGIYLFNYGLFF